MRPDAFIIGDNRGISHGFESCLEDGGVAGSPTAREDAADRASHAFYYS